MWHNDYVVIVIYEIYALKMWWCTIIIIVNFIIPYPYILLLKGENDPCVLISIVNSWV